MSLDLLISVVLYNNSAAEINTLIKSCSCPNLKINLVFVDNAPANQTFDFNAAPDWVSYLAMEKNLGFGSAHNKIILGEKEAKYFLILNPDIEFQPTILPKIIKHLTENSEVKLLMPRVLWPSGEDQGLRKLLPAPSDLVLRRFLPGPLKKLFSKKEASYQLQHLDASKAMQVPVLSGCFMFCPHDILRKIGGFDQNFFLYLEDVDLARRLVREGINLYWPEVSVVHHYQKSSYRSIKPLLLHLKSAWYYFSKYGWFIDKERKAVNSLAREQKQG